jgi:gluconolactonase
MRVLATGLKFPEGPVPLRDGSVLVVEIAGGQVRRVSASGEVSLVAETGGGPNGLAIGPDGAAYVCNNGGLLFVTEEGMTRARHGVPSDYVTGSIQRIDLADGSLTTVYTHCGDVPLLGPNDLVFDAHGGFYFTDYGKTRHRDRDIGSIYYALPDGSKIVELVHPIANPNGIGLSPDGHTLYVSETETTRLWAYPVVAPGVLELAPFPSPNGGRLVYGAPGYQRFDSLAVQANGDICVATLITGCITVISPGGELVREVTLPDALTTNIAFGVQDPRKAYVTQSMTGRLVELDWEEEGLQLNYEA